MDISGKSYVGGLVGYNYSGTAGYCHFNSETSGQSAGIGVDNNSQTVTGYTTAQMKQRAYFTDWDSSTVWAFHADSTYPALQAVNNASFAFADTISLDSSASIIDDDYDYESG